MVDIKIIIFEFFKILNDPLYPKEVSKIILTFFFNLSKIL